MTDSKTKDRHRKAKILLRVLIVVSIVFAWGHSMIPAAESSEESGFVLELLKPVLSVFLPEDMITGLFIRKLAHFCEYALMGLEMSAYAALIIRMRKEAVCEETDRKEVLCADNADKADKTNTINKTDITVKKTHKKQVIRLAINTIFCGLTVAFIDETIQTFSPGRGPEIADVWLDMGGFSSGGLIILLICLITVQKKRIIKPEPEDS